MPGARLLTFESKFEARPAEPNQPWSNQSGATVGWIGFLPRSGPADQGGTYVVGAKCSTLTEMVRVVDQLKSDLDSILEKARAALPR